LTPPAVSGGSWTVATLYNFAGGAADGTQPLSLILGPDGSFYGTTESGGSATHVGDGIVFQLSPPAVAGGTWTESVLQTFSSEASGLHPNSLAFQGPDLIGTTSAGKPSKTCGKTGCGVLFELTPPAVSGGSWTYTVLDSFTGKDGSYGQGLVAIGDTVFGTANKGGTSAACASGCGTVFELTF